MGSILSGLLVSGLLLVTEPSLASETQVPGLTVDEVLDRYVEARGGVEAWEAIETLTFRGNYTSFSKTAPYVWHHGGEQRTRFQSLMNEHPFVMAYDGEVYWGEGWAFDPEWPAPMNGANIVAFRQEVDQPSTLFYARDRGLRLTLIGPTEVDGIPAIGLELIREDGEKETWYLDPQTYLEVARHSSGSDFGRPEEQRYFYDDFREVAGVRIPHFVEGQWYTRYRTLEVESVSVNDPLEDALFELPPPTGMEAFAEMAGTWEVTFEHRRRPNAEFETEAMTAEIELLIDGAALQERITEPDGTKVVYSLSYDRFRDVYRYTMLNSYTTHLDLSVGILEEDGRIVLNNLESGTARAIGDRSMHLRYAFQPQADDGEFRWEVEASTDAGETWMLLERRTYRRPEVE